MASTLNYRGLVAWQQGMDLVEIVYTLSRTWPREEVYGLTGQLRRAAISVPSNIAEGQGRNSDGAFSHFLAIALGSLYEIETQLMIAQRLNYIDAATLDTALAQTSRVARLIHGLARNLRQSGEPEA
jgi:four helix bundle protein